MNKTWLIFIIGTGLLCAGGTFAQEEPWPPADIYSLSLEELAELPVSIATRSDQAMAEAPGIITVITREDIRQMNPRYLSDVLNLVPGFDYTVESLHATLFAYRGFYRRHDTMLLMIDGHRLNGQYFGSLTYILNDIPVEIVDRLEIIRGPGSAVYGGNAFHAVINIITVPRARNQSSALVAKYGTDHSREGVITHAGVTTNGHQVAAASFAKSDGPEYDYTDKAGKSGQTYYPRERPFLYGNIREGPFQVLALFSREKVGPFAGLSNYLGDRTSREYTTLAVEGTYDYLSPATNWGTTGKLYYDGFYYDCLWEVAPVSSTRPNGLLWDSTVEDYRVGTEWTAFRQLSATHRVLGGVELNRMGMYHSTMSKNEPDPYVMSDVPGGTGPAEDHTHAAVFLQDQQTFFPASDLAWLRNINLVLGIRYDYYEKWGDALSPRVGLSKKLGHHHNLKLLYGHAFRPPSYYESNLNEAGGMTPNPDLEPELMDTIEAELSREYPNHSVRLNAFYMRVRDLIETDRNYKPLPKKINVGEVTSQGLEGETKVNLFSPDHTLTLNGYWNTSEDGDGQEIYNVPHYGAAAILQNRWLYWLNSSLQVKYTGPIDKQPIAGTDRINDLSDTITVNLALNFTWRRFTLKTTAFNLFDEELLAPSSSTLTAQGEPLDNYPYNRRFLTAALEYRF